jgi:hypothetical protein
LSNHDYALDIVAPKCNLKWAVRISYSQERVRCSKLSGRNHRSHIIKSIREPIPNSKMGKDYLSKCWGLSSKHYVRTLIKVLVDRNYEGFEGIELRLWKMSNMVKILRRRWKSLWFPYTFHHYPLYLWSFFPFMINYKNMEIKRIIDEFFLPCVFKEKKSSS